MSAKYTMCVLFNKLASSLYERVSVDKNIHFLIVYELTSNIKKIIELSEQNSLLVKPGTDLRSFRNYRPVEVVKEDLLGFHLII